MLAGPAGVDRGRVAGAPLEQVEPAEQERSGRPAQQPELPAVLDCHAVAPSAWATRLVSSRAAATVGFAGSTWIGSPT